MKAKKLYVKFFALICGLSGFLILGWVFGPIIAYEVVSPRYESYLSPIPEKETLARSTDYTKASNWFDGDSPQDFGVTNVSFYTISIPRLGIKKATVAIGGEDLAKSLIQYPGTAVPGKPGNAVIFGHSILPQFFNPADYMSVFSTLPTLQKGDEILVDYDGVSFKFRVQDKFEVHPTDLQILEQNPSDSFLSLVTCVPPGHPGRPRRLIVRARVVPLDQ